VDEGRQGSRAQAGRVTCEPVSGLAIMHRSVQKTNVGLQDLTPLVAK
jgi:hypothetical protein